MKLTVSLSTERILESVYAHSAAHCITDGSDTPKLLGSDQSEMLKRISRDIIAGMLFKMGRIVVGSNIATEGSEDIVLADLEIADHIVPHVLRTTMETAASAGVLSAVWAGNDSSLSERYRQLYDDCIEQTSRFVYRSFPDAIAPTA